ncbi:hypothetical protein D4764_20G0007690 [Takifugu flavidus]|uniref:Reverse transcriptase domain-containing protein n=1 Tax=Takifugu flavidus TaxID=433684 RepID=A0A5C6NM24_9TELE|nr:hypothetical protein D4764_20G0007690 [Takifugu flavidus]
MRGLKLPRAVVVDSTLHHRVDIGGGAAGLAGWGTGEEDPRIQEEQCGFRPGRGTVDQLYTLSRVFEGAWEFAQPVHMCFVDLEKAFDRVPRGVLWGVIQEYGVSGPLIRTVRCLYDRCQSLVRIAGSKSNSFPVRVGLRQGCPLSRFCS